MPQQTKADPNEGQHEIQTEQVPVREFLTPVREPERVRPRGEVPDRFGRRGDCFGQDGEEGEEERGGREGKVEEIIDDDGEGDQEPLRDLCPQHAR